MSTLRFTLLHSNDIHADFQAEAQSGRAVGGLALLSGYINRVRREAENVLYVIAGDMVQGSVIDSEFKGISTIELMNYLAPDVASLGNHELDYGLTHLLFLEKMANFPIVVANLYIKRYRKRLMQPYHVINIAGFDVMFIGIITEEILQTLKMDSDIGTFLTLEEARDEVGRICNAYKTEDIDLTVLLTHIGFELDKELAAMLDPAWGVDLIIGGHSHTVMDEPARVNDILIAQAGTGSDQIGRFDIAVDDATNRIVDWTWRLVPIDSTSAEPDSDLQQFIDTYQSTVDLRYRTLLCRFARPLTHPRREEETELGNLFADILAQAARADVAFVGSGSIRDTKLGPVVTLGDLVRIYPFDEALFKYTVTGAMLTRLFDYIMRPANRVPGAGQCQQVSRGVQAIYDETAQRLESLTLDGEPVLPDRQYTICLQAFHAINSRVNLGLEEAELVKLDRPRVVTTAIRDVLIAWFQQHHVLDSRVEGRLVYRGRE